jgi:hypothetical protein
MKKGTVIALVIAVVLLIGAGMYAVSKSSDKSSNATKTDTSTSSNANNQDTSAQAANVVAIADMAFSPAKIIIPLPWTRAPQAAQIAGTWQIISRIALPLMLWATFPITVPCTRV